MQFNAAFSVTRINPRFVLIRVDREKQRLKREKLGLIDIPPTLVHMNYNQQIGEILMIGQDIQNLMPNMQVGDDLLFHHSIEGSVMSAAEQKSFKPVIIWTVHDNQYIDPFVYYVVREDFIYGYRDRQGRITTHPERALALASPEEQDNRDLKKVGSLYLFKNFKEEREQIQKRIDAMKKECETHPDRAAIIMPEMEALTKSLNKKRSAAFMPVFIGEKILRDFLPYQIDSTWVFYYEFIGSASTTPQVTTIQIDGRYFYILRSDYILLAKRITAFERIEAGELTFEDYLRDLREKEQKKLSDLGEVKEVRLAPGLIALPK